MADKKTIKVEQTGSPIGRTVICTNVKHKQKQG